MYKKMYITLFNAITDAINETDVNIIKDRVTRVIRTCLKPAYFGAFHPIYFCKAIALLHLN